MSVTALLGPTNTGKTHRAIERMLEHGSGMIGLPLRLLAREVYDKISARVGEARVALVTGEEQRIPARPSYWVATVEAMPVDKEVELVAVDEIQLAAHEQRGPVFPSRILSARGTKETWLLGSRAMQPILRDLVPTARVAEHPRLSQLSFAGAMPLSRLPPRSAAVAFSMPHVYELAERLRAKRGGAAVVLGALSPRTRNAQVAMFQAGEVDYLVATDAIGMGLNLDVDHVAFAALRKFDGRDVRDVDDAELAQIAGRAGRWIQDGTFGTLTPLEMPTSVARTIEAHHVAPVRRVRWRNDRLDFDSVAALRSSLSIGPTRPMLAFARDAEDARALALLAQREEVLRGASDAERVRLLWDVCSVPDFRKLLFEVHVDFLGELFVELARAGRLSNDWIAARVRELEQMDGDVETLVSRIAATRTWTYVANRATWLDEPLAWQEWTRDLEDRLSDALHQQLVARFVEPRRGRVTARARPRRHGAAHDPARAQAALELTEPRRGRTVDASHPFAKLAELRDAMAGPGTNDTSPLAGRTPAWVDEIVDAPPDAFVLASPARVVHRPSGRTCGLLVGGTSIALPDVRLEGASDVGAGARARLLRRVLAAARDAVTDLVGPAREVALRAGASAHVRGLVHRLEQGLGTMLAADLADVLECLSDEDRAELAQAGVVLGKVVVYMPRGLRPEAVLARAALAAAFHGAGRSLAPPPKGSVSFVPTRGVDPRAYAAIGYPVFGARALRADVLDRVLTCIAAANDATDDATLASWLGLPARELRTVLSSPVPRLPRLPRAGDDRG
jgi:ATP-dependent RNA helicase SUPV3L1/SUV3